MLDNNSLVVFSYLRNHFSKSDKSLQFPEINIQELSFKDIEESFKTLLNHGKITTTDTDYLNRITVTGIVD